MIVFRLHKGINALLKTALPPRDGTVVDHTWRYVNKSGGPDKRFKNNRQLPIMLYTEVDFTSNTGINERVQFSRSNIAEAFINQLDLYKQRGFLQLKKPNVEKGFDRSTEVL